METRSKMHEIYPGKKWKHNVDELKSLSCNECDNATILEYIFVEIYLYDNLKG